MLTTKRVRLAKLEGLVEIVESKHSYAYSMIELNRPGSRLWIFPSIFKIAER